MALKMDRLIDATEIGYFLNEVAERGVVVSTSTAGSGINLDNTASVATVAAATGATTRPLGILLNDFVNVDQTRIGVNWFKDQSQIGNKCTILTKGWVVTDKVVGTPQAGDLAVLAASGFIGAVAVGTASTAASPIIGHFRSRKSEDGFARVYVDL
jgi:hypothetical protein